jgi:hypothetical protein
MRTFLGSQATGRTPRPARLLALLALLAAATLGVSLVATTPLALQADDGGALAADVVTDPDIGSWPGPDAATVGDWQVSWTHNARFAVSWNKLSTGAAASAPTTPGW